MKKKMGSEYAAVNIVHYGQIVWIANCAPRTDPRGAHGRIDVQLNNWHCMGDLDNRHKVEKNLALHGVYQQES
jgi:hypothetical protein